jgi:hypothetical protein
VVAVAAAEIHLQFASVAHNTIGFAEQTALEAVSVEAPGAVSVILQRLCHVPVYLAPVATACGNGATRDRLSAGPRASLAAPPARVVEGHDPLPPVSVGHF